MSKRREWRVLGRGDEERLGRSLIAVQLIGEFIGGTVEITSPKDAEPVTLPVEGGDLEPVPAWLFAWEGQEGEKPSWTVDIDDEEGLERSEMAVDLVTEFLGGVFTVAAIRRDGEFVTTARMWMWKSYVPALRPPVEDAPLNGQPETVATG